MNEKKSEIDDLLALAETPAEAGSPADNEELSEAHRFVLSVGVKPGHRAVPALLIWDKYQQWCTSLDHKPISKIEFFRQFAKLFPKKVTTKMRYYKLDPAPFNLSKEYYCIKLWEMQGERKKKMRAKERKAQKEYERAQKELAENKSEISRTDESGTSQK